MTQRPRWAGPWRLNRATMQWEREARIEGGWDWTEGHWVFRWYVFRGPVVSQ